MKRFILVITLIAVPMITWAQVDDIVAGDIEQLYADQPQAQATTAQTGGNSRKVLPTGEVVEMDGSVAQAKQPIYILNNTTSGANARNEALQSQTSYVQQQPVTEINASPLSKSRAEQMRDQRQNVELQTELKIVEKLEQSRMEDEQKRAERIFGGKLERNQEPVVVAQPVIVTPEQTHFNNREASTDNIRNEIREALADVKSKDEKESEDKYYMSGIVGLGEYVDAINVKGNVTAGFGVGTKIDDRILVTAEFIYGNYDIEDVNSVATTSYLPKITTMDQYSVNGTVKYQIFGGKIRPLIGLVTSYSYRSYTETQYYFSSSDADSHAFDLGLLGGVDLELSSRFAIGGEFRYMKNITSRTSNSLNQSIVYRQPGVKPIEELSYYVFSVNARYNF